MQYWDNKLLIILPIGIRIRIATFLMFSFLKAYIFFDCLILGVKGFHDLGIVISIGNIVLSKALVYLVFNFAAS